MCNVRSVCNVCSVCNVRSVCRGVIEDVSLWEIASLREGLILGYCVIVCRVDCRKLCEGV